MKRNDLNTPLLVLLMLLAVALPIGCGVFSAHMESVTYNKLTGANTTTFDALWVDLRVIGEPRQIFPTTP